MKGDEGPGGLAGPDIPGALKRLTECSDLTELDRNLQAQTLGQTQVSRVAAFYDLTCPIFQQILWTQRETGKPGSDVGEEASSPKALEEAPMLDLSGHSFTSRNQKDTERLNPIASCHLRGCLELHLSWTLADGFLPAPSPLLPPPGIL